jgi:2-amino-4-hydroxy-6-hydroxymethyldihydropteridine diphosphokinase
MTVAYIGLGSNLGDRESLIRRAAELIGAARLSEVRETEPWGYV